MITPAGIAVKYTLYGQIIPFGCPGGKNDFFGVSPYQLSNLRPGYIYGFFSLPAKGMSTAGCIPKAVREIGQHRLHDTGIAGGSCIVIQVNGQFQHCIDTLHVNVQNYFKSLKNNSLAARYPYITDIQGQLKKIRGSGISMIRL